jgi:hypothetical protein
MHPTGSGSQINELDPRADEHLYGDSSTDALVSQVQQAAMNSPTSTRSGPESHAAELAGVLYTGSTPSAVEIQEQDPNIFVIPPRKTADVFVSCYWEFLHPVFPILQRYTFQSRYENLWAASDKFDDANSLDQTIFHATLNLVFALGSQLSSIVAPNKKPSYADEFYQRSRTMINFEILDARQLSLVQMLLLTGVYLQSTVYATRCWNVVGLAVRAAQGLGLHFSEATTRFAKPVRE